MPRSAPIRSLTPLWLLLAVWTALTASCGGDGDDSVPTASAGPSITVTSEALEEGATIPADYSCDGDLGSPDLAWNGIPDGTGSLVVLSLDPDANNFVHWLVYGIPPDTVAIPWGISNEPELADGSRQGKNSFGDTGYGPLCPPEGSTHTYQFFVYALDTQISEASGASRGDIEGLMEGHILAWGVLTGNFGR